MSEIEKERHAKRRKLNIAKALRKKNISDARPWISGWYDNLHQYSKNKIFCSCPSCTTKTNRKDVRGKGHGISKISFGETYHRKGKNWSIADLKKIERMEVDEEDNRVHSIADTE